ncbi:MAG: hypothetical protein R3282_06845, partial [Rhodothermales bacterium]|nr:hypothetical protein [Rhodothermales bacterium]
MKRHLALLRLASTSVRTAGFLLLMATVAVSSVAQTQLDILPIDDQFTNEGDVLVVPITAQDISASTFEGFVFDGLPSFATAVDNGDGTASITMNPLAGHGGIYQIVVSASDVELQQFDSEVFAVAVAFTGNVGLPVTLPVSLAFAPIPVTSQLFFRSSGASAFQSTPLTQIADTRFEGTIPDGPETLRGVEYYVQFFDREVFTTLPTVEPTTRPARLRYRFNLLEEIALEPVTYRMISVPAILDNSDPIHSLADDLETPDPSSWRVLRWAPVDERYDEPPLLDAQFDPGVAFWIISATSAAISVGPGLSTDVETAQELVLEAGWNQIGSPFAFPVAWSDIDPNRTVESPVAYNGVEYVYDQSVLFPWDGYFVYNPQSSTVLLPVPPLEAGARAQKAARLPTALYG